ncbi:response regulator [Thauera sp. CAU 1555]|uniref:histidine kinase n=1 Tax=Thauera sedimentorum TaxID=2767595 RepID=A0ABR9B657_9RHOO|nr:ATP-binding protein [Thauera sedimentorum]MBC9070930.1 response regulator [Thauera sedimentorum]MBD8501849.1 response regulator [Thauera sedimentorum]
MSESSPDEPQSVGVRSFGLALPAIALALLVGATGVLLYLQAEMREHERVVAIDDARSFASSVLRFRDFYSREIVPRAEQAGMFVSHNYRHIPNSLPLPATFTLEFGDYLSGQSDGFAVNLYSDHPFPWRADDRRLDEFQRAALDHLRKAPDQPYSRVEVRGEGAVLRLAVADRMKPDCVACHNTYRGSPKSDWKVGDIRGVMEVVRPLSRADAALDSGVRNAILMTFMLIGAAVVVLWLVMRRLHLSVGDSQRHAALVWRVNEHLREEIGHRRSVESALRFNEAKLRAIFDGVLEAVVVIDEHGCVVEANQVAAQMFGYPMEELIGCNVGALLPTKDAAEMDDGEAKLFSDGPGHQVVGRRRNGQIFPVSLAVNDVALGQQGFFVGIISDVTERLRHESEMQAARDAALASARLKSEFLANMSHEIRTPMNGVIGMTGLLRETQLDAHQRDLLETVERSSSALLDIINDILDLSKIEAGKLELKRAEFDPVVTVNDVVKLFAGKAREKGIELTCSCEPGLSRWVSGDEGRFRQVLSNLVGNAVKFTDAGKVHVRMTALPGDGECAIHVEDTGIGIPEEHRDQLFEPFMQVDGSTTRQYGGTGLGLAISRELVHKMGGRIDLESREGEGSVFSFTVRFEAPLAPQPAASCDDLPPMLQARPARILVAEDNAVNQRLIRILLEKDGHQVDVVDNGVKAIEHLAEGRCDMVLMDCQMPEMDGFQATEAWRSQEGVRGKGRVPIVALTANAMEGDRERCLAAGMDDYLTKPVDRRRLAEVISRLLRRDAANGQDT